jgi:hypothetical protein
MLIMKRRNIPDTGCLLHLPCCCQPRVRCLLHIASILPESYLGRGGAPNHAFWHRVELRRSILDRFCGNANLFEYFQGTQGPVGPCQTCQCVCMFRCIFPTVHREDPRRGDLTETCSSMHIPSLALVSIGVPWQCECGSSHSFCRQRRSNRTKHNDEGGQTEHSVRSTVGLSLRPPPHPTTSRGPEGHWEGLRDVAGGVPRKREGAFA